MARTKISEFSATPSDNTDIDGIDIAEGCAPSGINNAIRELMAQLKDMQTGASGDTFTLTTVNSTTVDTTNLEATNLKAKDGTSAGSIANSTGVVTLASSVLTTTDINGGTVDGTTIGATTPSTVVATQVDITAQGDLRLQDTTGGQYVALQAPGTIATSYTLTLPVDDGTSGQALITDGSGVLSWSTAASGDVYGPASATDNAVARYDGTTGKIIQNSAVTIADDGATVIDVNSTSAGLRITQVGAGNALLVEDSANPDASPTVIAADGVVRIGSLTNNNTVYGTSQFAPGFQLYNTAGTGGFYRYAADADGSALIFAKSRNATVGSQTVVNPSDTLGYLGFAGSDGTNFTTGATITASVDGTPGTNDMPGRLVFSTTADGASSPTERMRIDSAGNVGIGTTAQAFEKLVLGGTFPSSSANTRTNVVRGTIPSSTTSLFNGFRTEVATQAASFTLSALAHFNASQGTFGASSVVTNQYGFLVDSNLIGATNNYGFYSTIASGTGRWNFYAAGTATNYFEGNVAIGNSGFTSGKLNVSGGTIEFDPGSGADSTRAFNFNIGATNFGKILIPSGSGGAMAFSAGSTVVERFRIGSTGTISLGAAPGAESLRVTPVASAVNYLNVSGAITGNRVDLRADGSDTNIGLFYAAKGTGDHVFRTNTYGGAPTQFIVAHTASAVNYLQVTGAATTAAPLLLTVGSDTNINLFVSTKGNGAHYFQTSSSGANQFVIAHTASTVNVLQVTGGATGVAPSMAAAGSDANIDLALTSKGTGRVRFGTLTATSDVAITGYIEIKDSAGNVRKLAVIT